MAQLFADAVWSDMTNNAPAAPQQQFPLPQQLPQPQLQQQQAPFSVPAAPPLMMMPQHQQQGVPAPFPPPLQQQQQPMQQPPVMAGALPQQQVAGSAAPTVFVQLANGMLVPATMPVMPMHPPQQAQPIQQFAQQVPMQPQPTVMPPHAGGGKPGQARFAHQQQQPQQQQAAISEQPLLSLVRELSAGLVQRDVTTVASAVTPIAVARLEQLVQLCYSTFSTDRDLMNFVKHQFGVELCLQVRDYLVEQHDTVIKTIPDDTPAAERKRLLASSVLATDMLERRGVMLVSLVEVLCTTPTPCSHEEQFLGATDAEKNLTSFCPLTRATFRTLYSDCITNPRGCIGLLRLFSSTATAPRPVDNMVAATTRHLSTLIFDSHANYLVSHILCTCQQDEKPPEARVFEPVDRDEMLLRTPTILALSATNSPTAPPKARTNGARGGANEAELPPRRIAKASPAVWAAFVTELVRVLCADIVRSATHREATHVLEHTLRRLAFDAVPGSEQLLEALAGDSKTVMVPILQSPCGRHCMRAMVDALLNRGGAIRFSTIKFCSNRLFALCGEVRTGVVTVPQFDVIDAAVRRLPRLE